MARRRQNVSTTWYVVGTVAGVAALGALTYVLVRRSRIKIDVKKEGGCPPEGDHVGGALTTWPYSDVFLDESGFGEALESFGYDVGDWSSPDWHVCDLQMQEAVIAFTRDYNAVVTIVEDPPIDRLPINGMIREPTITAMAYVDALQREADFSWPILVEEVRRAKEEEQS